MRLTKLLAVLLLAPTLMWAQSSTGSTSTSGDTPNVNEQINKLSDAIAAQQAQIAAQQDQMKKQQQDLEKLRAQLAEQKAAANNSAHVVDASLNTTNATTVAAQTGGKQQPEAEGTGKTSPLSFRIGAAEFTPGGFIDFTNVFRTRNLGSSVSTGFASVPFSNTAAGHLTELRTTSQYSRLSMKASSNVHGADVLGYFEVDFNGNDAANVFVTTNPHTLRLRMAYLQLKDGPIELVGGQGYGWLTPNRVGLSPTSADLMITNNSDGNINIGLPFTRPSMLHFILHPSKHVGFGVGLETQEQFTTNVVFPSALNTTLTPEATPGTTPNLHPSILAKLALDSNPGGRNFHFEVTGIANSTKIAFAPVGAPAGTFVTNTKTGGGIQLATSLDFTKKFRFVGNAFWSNGGGREAEALGPDFVVRPDGSISLVHAGSGLVGLEASLSKTTAISAYYGVNYYQRNFFVDTTAAARPLIGFGGPTSPNSNNRAFQEPTLDITHNFWKSPQWGAIALNLQSSYLVRSPWNAVGSPKNAHTFMQYVVLRYILP